MISTKRSVLPVLATALALSLATGCGESTTGYDADWHADLPGNGKADGLFDDLQSLAFGDSVDGDVGGARLEVYGVTVHTGDRFAVEMKKTSGDLDPNIAVYFDGETYVSSADWSREGATLRKEYAAERTGLYVIAAGAYKGRGEGDYTLTLSCISGVCAGEPGPVADDLTAGEAALCLREARKCAFAALPQYAGAVGAARAESIVAACLAAAKTDKDESCDAACDWTTSRGFGSDSSAAYCTSLKAALVFYADQDAACLGELDACVSECAGGDTDYPETEDFYSTLESLCFDSGFNGNCDSYARASAACGGAVPKDSAEDCLDFCKSTFGARNDDLDTVCDQDSNCDDQCDKDFDAAVAKCGESSEDNVDCFDDYINERSLYLCEDTFQNSI